jgi:hypothetical protein
MCAPGLAAGNEPLWPPACLVLHAARGSASSRPGRRATSMSARGSASSSRQQPSWVHAHQQQQKLQQQRAQAARPAAAAAAVARIGQRRATAACLCPGRCCTPASDTRSWRRRRRTASSLWASKMLATGKAGTGAIELRLPHKCPGVARAVAAAICCYVPAASRPPAPLPCPARAPLPAAVAMPTACCRRCWPPPR